MSNHVAIIDLGSNTFHLLIKGIDSSGLGFDLFSKQCHVKIAEGGLSDNQILPEAQKRALKTFKEFKELTDELGVDTIIAFATSAFRDATNADDLLREGSKILDTDIEIISGAREAELIFKGVIKAYKPGNKPYFIIDIGGGSVEFVIGLKKKLIWSQSLPIGGLRLTNSFQDQYPMSREKVADIQRFLADQLKEVKSAIAEHKPRILIGAAGAFETLSRIEHINLLNKPYPDYAGKLEIKLEHFYEISALIQRSERNELYEIPGMHNYRAEQMPVSVVLIESVLKMGDFKELWYSDYSMKEGIFYEYLEQSK